MPYLRDLQVPHGAHIKLGDLAQKGGRPSRLTFLRGNPPTTTNTCEQEATGRPLDKLTCLLAPTPRFRSNRPFGNRRIDGRVSGPHSYIFLHLLRFLRTRKKTQSMGPSDGIIGFPGQRFYQRGIYLSSRGIYGRVLRAGTQHLAYRTSLLWALTLKP